MERRATLVTQHAKLGTIGPVFAEFGWDLDAVVADTDQLGTFSGDVARRYSPRETARRKALLGAAATDRPWLVASEGTISSPIIGLVDDLEIVALVEREGARVVVGKAIGRDLPVVALRVDESTSEDAILRFCATADLPRHALLVAASDHAVSSQGGLTTPHQVLSACRSLRRSGRRLIVQTDLRAHLCPSRRDVIGRAARDLMIRLTQSCPRCEEPGFGDDGFVTGLPCGTCGSPTDEPLARRWGCSACDYYEDRLIGGRSDASRCATCNP